MLAPTAASTRKWLRARFREQGLPLLQSDGITIPAASLWAGSRLWIGHLRDAAVESGSRVWIDLAPGPTTLQCLLASWWLECDVVLGSLDSADAGGTPEEGGFHHAIACLDAPRVTRPKGIAGPAIGNEAASWSGTPSAHAPWLLEWETAATALLRTPRRAPGISVDIPRSWTDREVLIGRVLPALASDSVLVEEGFLAQGAADGWYRAARCASFAGDSPWPERRFP